MSLSLEVWFAEMSQIQLTRKQLDPSATLMLMQGALSSLFRPPFGLICNPSSSASHFCAINPEIQSQIQIRLKLQREIKILTQIQIHIYSASHLCAIHPSWAASAEMIVWSVHDLGLPSWCNQCYLTEISGCKCYLTEISRCTHCYLTEISGCKYRYKLRYRYKWFCYHFTICYLAISVQSVLSHRDQ